LWTFGDGSTSTLQNPTYTYNVSGKYTVTLTVTNIAGFSVHTNSIAINSDPSFAAVILLMNGDQATVNDVIGNPLLPLGTVPPVIATNVVKYGPGSIYFNGAGGYRIKYTTAFNLNLIDWTIEAWVNPAQIAKVMAVVSKDTYGANFDWCMVFPAGGKSIMLASSGTTVVLTAVIPVLVIGAWYHVAIVSHSGVITIYLNGTAVGSKTMGISNSDTTALSVGCASYNNPSEFFNGYIDDLRITRAARYTANFVPPGMLTAF